MNKKVVRYPVLFLILIVIFGLFQSCTKTSKDSTNYPYVHEPVVKPSFIPIPFGNIEATGWIRDWAVLTKDGLVGNSVAFQKGWGNGMPEPFLNEQTAYWIDGMLRTGYILHDSTLINRAQHDIDEFLLNRKYESCWAMAVYGRAIMAYFHATGDNRILKAMNQLYSTSDLTGFWEITKLFGNLKPVFGEGVTADIPSIVEHEPRNLVQAEAMLEAFSYGGDSLLLKNVLTTMKKYDTRFINHFLNRNRENRINNNGCLLSMHGVTYNEINKLWALAYLYNGNPAYLQTSINAFKELDDNNMMPFGVNSSEENLMGVDAVGSSETCDISDFINSNIALFRITGNSSYGDKIERALFNAGGTAWSHDCKKHVYSQSPNKLTLTDAPKIKGHYEYKSLHDPLCCTANITRIIPNYVLHSWMATPDNGVAAMLYGPSQARVKVADNVEITIIEKTDYPFDENINLSIKSPKRVDFPLYLRIPQWCKNPIVSVAGKQLEVTKNKTGFMVINRKWETETTVKITFGMQTKFVKGFTKSNGACSSLDKSKKLTSGLPYTIVERGPLLYTLKIENENTKYRYAINPLEQNFSVSKTAMPENFDWGKTPISIQLNAQAIEWNDCPKLEKTIIKKSGTTETITLVPYGSSEGTRITMFPIVK